MGQAFGCLVEAGWVLKGPATKNLLYLKKNKRQMWAMTVLEVLAVFYHLRYKIKEIKSWLNMHSEQKLSCIRNIWGAALAGERCFRYQWDSLGCISLNLSKSKGITKVIPILQQSSRRFPQNHTREPHGGAKGDVGITKVSMIDPLGSTNIQHFMSLCGETFLSEGK